MEVYLSLLQIPLSNFGGLLLQSSVGNHQVEVAVLAAH
ncbi:hypothetical protein AVEN_215427-1, partial [Araneus ventricosus]